MKKLVYLLSILLLPFVSFADLLPEPDDINGITDNEEVVVEEKIESLNDEIMEEKINTEDENSNENSVLREANVTAKQVEENENLHEVGEDGGLKWISFGYCNEGVDNLSETLSYAVTQGEPFKVCFMMSNSTNKDIKINIDLVDLVDGICSISSKSIIQFIPKEELEGLNEFVIPAGNYVIKEFSISYPIGVQGDQGACTTFNIVKDAEAQGNVAAVVARAYPMKFFVGGLKDVKNIVTIDNIELSLDDNKDLIMNFDVKNEGNLENLVELSGTISNIFGYSKKFSIEEGHVLPGNFWHVEANLGSIPSYGGLFNIDFKAFATPYFSYDISNSSIDPSLIEMKTFDFSTKYFEMPWLIIAIAVVVILLLITMFKKSKQKVVYIQQPGQPVQPMQGQQVPQQYYPQQNVPQQSYPQQGYSQQQVQQPVQQQVQQPVQPQIQQPAQQQPVQNQQTDQNQQSPEAQDSRNPNIQ